MTSQRLPLFLFALVLVVFFWIDGRNEAQSAQPTCTPAQPCTVKILFTYTKKAEAQLLRLDRSYGATETIRRCKRNNYTLDFCLFKEIVIPLYVQPLVETFNISGVDNLVFKASVGSWPEIQKQVVESGATTGGCTDRIEKALDSLVKPNEAVRKGRMARNDDIVVLFIDGSNSCILGLAQPNSGNLVFGIEHAVNFLLGLKDRQYFERMVDVAIHEIGHIFFAGHNNHAILQPCSGSSCAYEHTPAECQALRKGQDEKWNDYVRRWQICAYKHKSTSFCTMMGQWERGNSRKPGSYGCKDLEGGSGGRGFLREFSHLGVCNSPAQKRNKILCGDKMHNAVATIKAWVPYVSQLDLRCHRPQWC